MGLQNDEKKQNLGCPIDNTGNPGVKKKGVIDSRACALGLKRLLPDPPRETWRLKNWALETKPLKTGRIVEKNFAVQ